MAFPGALELISGCKRFLGVYGMCFDQEKGVHYPASENSVFKYFLNFWNLVMGFHSSLHVLRNKVRFLAYMGRELGQG